MGSTPLTVKSLKLLVPGSQRGDPAHGSVGLCIGLRDLPRRSGGVFVRARVRHPDHEPGVASELGCTEVLPISEPNLDFSLPLSLHLAGPPGTVDLRLVVFEVFAVREAALPLPGAAPAPAAVAALDAEVLGEHVDRVLSSPADAGTPADGTALLDSAAHGSGLYAPVFERLRPRGGGGGAPDAAAAPFIIITAVPLTRQARALGALQLRLSFKGLPVRPSTSRPSAPFLMVHRHVGASEGALSERDFEVAWVSRPRRGGGKRDPNAPPPPGTPAFVSEPVVVTVPLVALLSAATRGADSVAALRASAGAAGAYVKLEVCDWDAVGALAGGGGGGSAGAGGGEGGGGGTITAAAAALTLSKMGHLVVHLGELVDPSFYPASGVSAALQTEGTISAGCGSAAVVIHGVALVEAPWPAGMEAPARTEAAPEAARGGGGGGEGGSGRAWDHNGGSSGGSGAGAPAAPLSALASPAAAPPPPASPPPAFLFAPPAAAGAPWSPAESAVARYIAEQGAPSPALQRSTRIELPTSEESAAALARYGGPAVGAGAAAPLPHAAAPPSPPAPQAPPPPSPPSPPPASRLAQSISNLQAVSRAAAEKGASARLNFPLFAGGTGSGRANPANGGGGGGGGGTPPPLSGSGSWRSVALGATSLAADAAQPRLPRAPPLPPSTLYAASIPPLPAVGPFYAAAASAGAMAAVLGIQPGAVGASAAAAATAPPSSRPATPKPWGGGSGGGGGAPAAGSPPHPPAPPPSTHPSAQLEKASLLVARSATVLTRLAAAAAEAADSREPGEWLRPHMGALESGALGAVLPPSATRLCAAAAALGLPRVAFSSVDEALLGALRRDAAAVADALQRAGGEEAAAERTQAARGRGELSSALGFHVSPAVGAALQLSAAAAAAASGGRPPPQPPPGLERTIDAVPAYQLEPLKAAAGAEVAALAGARWPLEALEAVDAHGAMKEALRAALAVLGAGGAGSAAARDTALREYDAAHCEALYLGGRREEALRELAALRGDAGALLERLRAARAALRAATREHHERLAADARRVAELEGFLWAGDDAARERERAALARMRALGSGAAEAPPPPPPLQPPPQRSATTSELLALAALEVSSSALGRSRRLGLAVGRAQATATGLHAESYAGLLEGVRREAEARLAEVRAAGEERLRAEAAMADGVFAAGERDGRGVEAEARARAEAAEAAREAELLPPGAEGAQLPPPLFTRGGAEAAREGSGEALERLAGAHVSTQWVARRLRAALADAEDRLALLTLRFGGARDLARLKDLCRVLWAYEGAAVTPLERQRFLARALSHAPYAPRLHDLLEVRHEELRRTQELAARLSRGGPSPAGAKGPLTPLKPFTFFTATAPAPPPPPQLVKTPVSALAAYLAER